MKSLYTLIIYMMLPLWAFCQQRVYEYPVRPGSPEWKAIMNTFDKIKVCQLPEGVLNNLSTKDLLEVCLDYPLLDDYIYANSPYEGLNNIINNFNGLREFVSRKDAFQVLFTKYSKIHIEDIEQINSLSGKGSFTINHSVLELLVVNEAILSNISETDKNNFLKQLLLTNGVKNKYREYYGLFADVTTAFTGNKIIETMKQKEPSTGPSSDEKTMQKQIFKNRMLLVAHQSTIEEVLNEVKDYVKNIK